MRYIWLSDLHFQAQGSVLGHDPKVRLQQCIELINETLSDAAFCIISGDMVNHGSDPDYAALGKYLNQLKMPYYPMVGNHDDRAGMAAHLDMPENKMADFVQYQIDLGETVFLALDTLKPGSGGGVFCTERQGWLSRKLTDHRNKQVLLFMHHPPMTLGLPMQDRENLENGDAFLDLIQQHDCVKHLCIGHVHRPISGLVRGIPFKTARSVLYQAPPPDPAWTWDSFAPAREAPTLQVISISGSDVTFQERQICPYDVGVV